MSEGQRLTRHALLARRLVELGTVRAVCTTLSAARAVYRERDPPTPLMSRVRISTSVFSHFLLSSLQVFGITNRDTNPYWLWWRAGPPSHAQLLCADVGRLQRHIQHAKLARLDADAQPEPERRDRQRRRQMLRVAHRRQPCRWRRGAESEPQRARLSWDVCRGRGQGRVLGANCSEYNAENKDLCSASRPRDLGRYGEVWGDCCSAFGCTRPQRERRGEDGEVDLLRRCDPTD